MAIVAGDGQHLRGHVFGQAVGEVVALDMNDFGDAGDLTGGLGGGFGALARHQHMHFATALERGGNGIERGRPDAGVVVFSDN